MATRQYGKGKMPEYDIDALADPEVATVDPEAKADAVAADVAPVPVSSPAVVRLKNTTGKKFSVPGFTWQVGEVKEVPSSWSEALIAKLATNGIVPAE